MSKRVKQLESLIDFFGRINMTNDLDDVYRYSVECLQIALGVDRSAILLLLEGKGMLFKYWENLSEEYRLAVEGHCPWDLSQEYYEPVLIEDVSSDEKLSDIRDVIEKEGIGAIGFIPMIVKGNLIGKFMLYYNTPHKFVRSEIKIAELLSSYVSYAIERMLYDRVIIESEELHKSLIETSPDGITMTDLEGRITYISRIAAQLYGCNDPGVMIGSSVFEYIVEDDRDRAREGMQRVISNGKVSNLQYRMYRQNGTDYHAELSASVIRDANGDPKGFISTVRDVSDRDKMRELRREVRDLQQQKQKLSIYTSALDLAAVPIIVWSISGIIYVNKRVSALTGYWKDELEKLTICDLIDKKDIRKYKSHVELLLNSDKGDSDVIKVRVKTKSGTSIEVEFNESRTIQDDQGDTITTVIRDYSYMSRKISESRARLRMIQKQLPNYGVEIGER